MRNSAKRSQVKFRSAQTKPRFSNRSAWQWRTLLQECWCIERLFWWQSRQLIRDQLPAGRTFYPNVGTPVLAADWLTTVLSLNRHAAGRYRTVLVNPHREILFFFNRIERSRGRFKLRQALRFGHYFPGRIHKDIIISPYSLECRNVAVQQRRAILLNHLPDLLSTVVVC